jgi:hypothetical protein
MPFPTIPSSRTLAGTDLLGIQCQRGILGEIGNNAFVRQFHAIALDAREHDLKSRTLLESLHAHGRFRSLRWRYNRFGGEIKGNAEYVGILNIEQTFLIQVIGLPAQPSPNHLFAEKLGTESAHAENVRYGVSVPPFRQHRDRHHAADVFAEPPFPADGVHHLAQQIRIGDILRGLLAGAGALNHFPLELLNFRACDLAEIRVKRLARLELLAIDQERIGPCQPVPVLVIVPEQVEMPLMDHLPFIIIVADAFPS